jgi:PPK2 family polyphosphate:nucleotide phosphotransferase
MSYAIRLSEGQRVDLAAIDPRQHGGLSRQEAEARFAALADELGELQELLYAAGTDALLVVLQGLDTSGKDGTIRDVLREVDPQGVRVVGFKVPTAIELAHDFLWRVHQQTPERGMIVVFNRSHYEDVIVVRVKRLIEEAVWQRRYGHINDFEALLTESGTIVAKFYLHISKDEQEERLLDREHDLEKAWKLSAGDWVERRSWNEYIAAYEDALSACTTADAPWYVVPADQKWYRDLAVAEILVDLLRPLRGRWLARLAEQGEAELAEVRKTRGAGADR